MIGEDVMASQHGDRPAAPAAPAGPAAQQRRRPGLQRGPRVQQHPDHDHQLRQARACGPRATRPARTQALEKILKGSQRAATIINSMLGFARNNSTQRELTDLVAWSRKC